MTSALFTSRFSLPVACLALGGLLLVSLAAASSGSQAHPPPVAAGATVDGQAAPPVAPASTSTATTRRLITFAPPATVRRSGGSATRPSESLPLTGCVTPDCHANIKEYKVLHGPVNVNACDACHKLEDAREHRYALVRNPTETCTFCHVVDKRGLDRVHKPMADGDCLGCHDPHGGRNATFTRGQTSADMCYRCHASITEGKKTMHGPVASGSCNACHTSHGSKFANNLNTQGQDNCYSCHTDMKTQMGKVKFQHKAVEQDCSACHDAHASNYPKQIKQPPFDMCVSCHEHDKIKTAATTSAVRHSVVTNEASCLNCHTAHGGELAKLMRKNTVDLCMDCHSSKIDVPGRPAVAAVNQVRDPALVKHGPIRDGSCGGCHDVHGSQVTRLLTREYPEAFYQAFALEKYDLCFTCHDRQLVLQQRTTTLTGFRNGEVNLHYLHVNKDERGRNCRACHESHASAQPKHVRTSVPYGNWQMPVTFSTTESGGSCAPGCHKAYTYDRVKPVNYAAPAPTTQPSSVPSKQGVAP